MEEKKQELTQAKNIKKPKGFLGFSGWLVLLAVGVIFNPLRLVLSMAQEYSTFGFDGLSYSINIILLISIFYISLFNAIKKKIFQKMVSHYIYYKYNIIWS